MKYENKKVLIYNEGHNWSPIYGKLKLHSKSYQ